MEDVIITGDRLPAPSPCLVEGLTRQGWWVGQDVLKPQLLVQLYREVLNRKYADNLHRAGIGRGEDFLLDRQIRGDRILWLSGASLAQCLLLEQMEELRQTLNQSLFLGLFDFECHFAVYPEGAFYKKHSDSFKGASNRIVSVVVYLNPDWAEGDGGELVIYDATTDKPITYVHPRAGTVVVFLSEEIPHEVLPTRRPRASIAGWFRLNNSLWNSIDPPR